MECGTFDVQAKRVLETWKLDLTSVFNKRGEEVA